MYLEPAAYHKNAHTVRENLTSLASLVTSLNKLIELIKKANTEADLKGVKTQHAKFTKVVQKRAEHTAKLQAQATKALLQKRKEEEMRQQAELERQEKENERLAKEQEKLKAKQEKEQALLLEK